MTATRTCGGCTLCCKLIGVEAINKPAGEWCAHCDKGSGCAINGSADRPEVCGQFECLWLSDRRGTIPENCRPDKARVVLGTTKDGRGIVAYCDPHIDPLTSPVGPLLIRAARHYVAVVIVRGGRRTFVGAGALGEVAP